MPRNNERPPAGGPGTDTNTVVRGTGRGVPSSVIVAQRADADPVPVALTIGATVEDIFRRCEADMAAAQWWYAFGRQCGIAEGKAQAEDELERVRLDREAVSQLRSTGETCPRCGRGQYARRWSA